MGSCEFINKGQFLEVCAGSSWEMENGESFAFLVGRVTSIWKLRCCNEMSSQNSRLFAEGCAEDQGLKLRLSLTVGLFYLFVLIGFCTCLG